MCNIVVVTVYISKSLIKKLHFSTKTYGLPGKGELIFFLFFSNHYQYLFPFFYDIICDDYNQKQTLVQTLLVTNMLKNAWVSIYYV